MIPMPYNDNYRAKSTFYRGVWYDSNTEAKVAEALDDIGIVYEYHRQCFRDKRFPWGQYTPDFHLPNTDTYIEVAGVLDQRHRGNLTTFCEIVGSCDPGNIWRVWFIDGEGNAKACHIENGMLRMQSAPVANIFYTAEHPGM